jgi:anthranilate phosphoribosyltransferase
MHGGDAMPTKYGLALIRIWQALDVELSNLSLLEAQLILEQLQLALIYIPKHFPLAQSMVSYRDELGKRPPLATAELVWVPYQGEIHLLAGYVHPPTEQLFQELLAFKQIEHYTTCKGLEGSIDLSINRSNILGLGQDSRLERLIISAGAYGFQARDVILESEKQAIEQIRSVIQGQPNSLWEPAVFYGGFYLWRLGVCPDLQTGFELAEKLLRERIVQARLQQLQELVKKQYDQKVHY